MLQREPERHRTNRRLPKWLKAITDASALQKALLIGIAICLIMSITAILFPNQVPIWFESKYVNGAAGVMTAVLLFVGVIRDDPDDNPPIRPTLQYEENINAFNPLVYELQLKIAGGGFAPIKVDGYFGKDTDKIVRQIEGQQGLIQDGIVDAEFWKIIEDESKMHGKYRIKVRS